MAHWSEDSVALELNTLPIYTLPEIETRSQGVPGVFLFWLPFRQNNDTNDRIRRGFERLTAYCGSLPKDSTVCFLTTPYEAALLIPLLENSLKFQLWIAVKTTPDAQTVTEGKLPQSHLALLSSRT